MYKKIELKYDTLEPYISNLTLTTHYNNHYLKYLNKLNELLADYNFNYTKEELIKEIDKINISNRDLIIYNLGGVLNHELYFNNLTNKMTELTPALLNKINEQYNGFDNFKIEFKRIALSLIGSGYTFLVINNNKDLQIINMSNQETPLLYDMYPIMTIDLWEHAYYLDYKNDKEKYIDAFFNILDLNYISNLYEQRIKN